MKPVLERERSFQKLQITLNSSSSKSLQTKKHYINLVTPIVRQESQ
jgi:hypothetical protein